MNGQQDLLGFTAEPQPVEEPEVVTVPSAEGSPPTSPAGDPGPVGPERSGEPTGTGEPAGPSPTWGDGTPVPTLAPAPEQVRHLSWSKLTTFQGCPQKYRLSYIDKVPQRPQANMIFGKAVHRAVEEAERVDWWRDEDSAKVRVTREAAFEGPLATFFFATFDLMLARAACQHDGISQWDEDPFHDVGSPEFAQDLARALVVTRWAGGAKYPKDYGWCKANGPLMLTRYGALRRQDEASGLAIRHVEAQLVVPLGPGLPVVKGYLDCAGVDDAETGETLFIRDYKTGTFMDPLQLAWYSLLYARSIGEGEIVTTGQFAKLGVNDPDKRVVEFDLAPWISLVEPKMQALARKLANEVEWDWNQSTFCVGCSVKAFCPWGKTLPDSGGE